MNGMRTKIRKTWYRVKRDFLTTQNVVMIVAIMLGLNWTWSAISTMHRNYDLQRRIESMRREEVILDLETQALEHEAAFYQSREFQELAARERLGLANPGERVLLLPPNSEEATNRHSVVDMSESEGESNLYQWMTFLFGGSARN